MKTLNQGKSDEEDLNELDNSDEGIRKGGEYIGLRHSPLSLWSSMDASLLISASLSLSVLPSAPTTFEAWDDAS